MTLDRRIAIATCTRFPDLDEDGPALVAALTERGIEAAPAIWDDPSVDWPSYELVLVRNTWDYVPRRAAFVAWAAGLPRVFNPAEVVRWTTDKAYLGDLAASGVAIVDTRFVFPGERGELPPWDEYVIKPTISAGSGDTARWRRGTDDRAARGHLDALLAAGRTAMIQPYLDAVDTVGESALIFLGGQFSHSVRKGPILEAGALRLPLDLDEHQTLGEMSPRTATADELEAARRALAAVPGNPDLLYARVDLLPGPDGTPLLLELELSEPSLFLWADPEAPGRLADAVVGALDSR